MVAETPLLLIGRRVARVSGGLTGAVEVAAGSRPLNQVTAGQRVAGFALAEREVTKRILGKSWCKEDLSSSDGARLTVPPCFKSLC